MEAGQPEREVDLHLDEARARAGDGRAVERRMHGARLCERRAVRPPEDVWAGALENGTPVSRCWPRNETASPPPTPVARHVGGEQYEEKKTDHEPRALQHRMPPSAERQQGGPDESRGRDGAGNDPGPRRGKLPQEPQTDRRRIGRPATPPPGNALALSDLPRQRLAEQTVLLEQLPLRLLRSPRGLLASELRLPIGPHLLVPGADLLAGERALTVRAPLRLARVVRLAARAAHEGLLPEVPPQSDRRGLAGETPRGRDLVVRRFPRPTRWPQAHEARQPSCHQRTTARRCAVEAGRVRFFDHSRSREMSSPMVAERGNASCTARITCAWRNSVDSPNA